MKLNTEPSIGASHQISTHFGKAVSEKESFYLFCVNGSKRNEQILRGFRGKAVLEIDQ
jgi:hypothetical protein